MLQQSFAFASIGAAVALWDPLPALGSPVEYNTNQTMAYNFKDVPISPDVTWKPCFQNFTCANLEVPLDYSNPDAGTTNVAFMRLEATTEPILGDIMINPGGPGNPGANVAAVTHFAKLIGTSWNIIGMDPRGVNNSGPVVDCFPDTYSRDYFLKHVMSPGLQPSSDEARAEIWRRAGMFNDFCAKAGFRNDTVRYANTPASAGDMLYFTEKVAESQGRDPREAKVNYFGVSYGSVLGATFATLFPDRLGRFIIDGAVDGEDYYGGDWLAVLSQADEALKSFFTYCAEAGPACQFSRGNDTAAGMHSRFDAMIADIEKNPLLVSDPALIEYPISLSHTSILGIILGQLYSFMQFPITDAMITELEDRNATTALSWMPSILLSYEGLIPLAKYHPSDAEPLIPRMVITCNDMNGRYNISSPEKFGEYVQQQVGVSKYFGTAFAAGVTVNCWNYPYEPVESQVFNGFKQTKTNNPILYLANKIDPVAFGYEKMSSFFEGSRVLLQDAVGHGMAAAESKCTSLHVQNFLQTGELPPEGLTCEVDQKPFDPVERTE